MPGFLNDMDGDGMGPLPFTVLGMALSAILLCSFMKPWSGCGTLLQGQFTKSSPVKILGNVIVEKKVFSTFENYQF